MGLGEEVNGSDEPQRDDSNSGDKQGTYIYFYEQGHEKMKQGMHPGAWELASSGGFFRQFFKGSKQYGDQAGFLSHIVVQLWEYIDNRNLRPLLDEIYIDGDDNDTAEVLDVIEPDEDELLEYLAQREDLWDDLVERMSETDAQEIFEDMEDSADEDEAPADD